MNTFEQLRRTVSDEPIAPDAGFAARLRARVKEALQPGATDVPSVRLPDRRPTMPTTEPAPTDPPTGTAVLIPYICVTGAAAAIDWYSTVLGAAETIRYVGDDGRVGHAEVTIGRARLMLSDEYPEIGVVSPTTLAGTTCTLNLNVDDCDAVWAEAIANGATGERPPADQPYGERSCTFRDPYGHRWSVQTTIAHPTPEQIVEQMPGYTIATPEHPEGEQGA